MSHSIFIRWYVQGVTGFDCDSEHLAEISKSELLACDTEAEVLRLAERCINDHFDNKFWPEWENKDMHKVVKAWRAMKESHD